MTLLVDLSFQWCNISIDPHIRVIGKPEHVQLAKEKIMAILDTKVSVIADQLLFVLGFTILRSQ